VSADENPLVTSPGARRIGSRAATLTGFGAVLLWSLLALFTTGAGPVPPLLLNALCFGIGGLVGLLWMRASGQGLASLRQVRWPVWLTGIAGLFGYHFCYFTALQLAPPAEASLICYLWPLFIVLFSGLLPGERLHWPHVAGALVAFAGAGLIVARPLLENGSGGVLDGGLAGYAAAFACALIWSGYSVTSRRFGSVPTSAVTVYCLATAVLSVLAHLAFEDTVWPGGALAWASVILLGLGPVGLAFYVWDVGVKQGNIQILGALSYAAPLISTLVLIAAGKAAASADLVVAAVLVTGGALLAALPSWRSARTQARATSRSISSLR
jgi:drug/metabolite transporter (DMT)-like permease